MQAYREGSSAFGEVRIQRTSSNHCEEEGSRATGKVRVSLGRFDYTEPPRITVKKGKAGLQGRVGAVLPHRTSSNHCDEGGCRLTGKVRVSSGRFDPTEAPRTTVTKGEAGLQGWFERVPGGSTPPLSLSRANGRRCRGSKRLTSSPSVGSWGKLVGRAVWSQFREVQLHRTFSNNCEVGGSRPTGKVQVEFGKVRLHRTASNHCAVGGSRPTGKVRVRLGWFDYTEPLRTTVRKGEAGLLGRFEGVLRTSSNHCDEGVKLVGRAV